MTKFTEVLHFNTAFGVEPLKHIVLERKGTEQIVIDTAHHNLIAEELDEYFDALRSNDRKAIADALTDMEYLIQGAWIRHGFEPRDQTNTWNEVHASNMAKLQPDGTVKRREDGKILKPDGWKAPNLDFIK